MLKLLHPVTSQPFVMQGHVVLDLKAMVDNKCNAQRNVKKPLPNVEGFSELCSQNSISNMHDYSRG